MYLETTAQPLKYIISSRRLMYLHHILSRDGIELIHRVYIAQSENPSDGDFLQLVNNYFCLIGKTLDEAKIRSFNKSEFKITQGIDDSARKPALRQDKILAIWLRKFTLI